MDLRDQLVPLEKLVQLDLLELREKQVQMVPQE